MTVKPKTRRLVWWLVAWRWKPGQEWFLADAYSKREAMEQVRDMRKDCDVSAPVRVVIEVPPR